MLGLYLAATVVGSVLLVASLFGDHHGQGGGGHDAAGHGDHGHDDKGLHISMWGLTSLRLWTYVLAFGGATGLLLRLVGGVSQVWSGVIAALVGFSTGLGASYVFAKAVTTDSPGTVSRSSLVGRAGEVIVAFGPGATGKVRVRALDGDIDLLATTEDPRGCAHGEKIAVVSFTNDSAVVARLDEPASSSSSRTGLRGGRPCRTHSRPVVSAPWKQTRLH